MRTNITSLSCCYGHFFLWDFLCLFHWDTEGESAGGFGWVQEGTEPLTCHLLPFSAQCLDTLTAFLAVSKHLLSSSEEGKVSRTFGSPTPLLASKDLLYSFVTQTAWSCLSKDVRLNPINQPSESTCKPACSLHPPAANSLADWFERCSWLGGWFHGLDGYASGTSISFTACQSSRITAPDTQS